MTEEEARAELARAEAELHEAFRPIAEEHGADPATVLFLWRMRQQRPADFERLEHLTEIAKQPLRPDERAARLREMAAVLAPKQDNP